MGVPTAGTYNVIFSKAGYYDKLFNGVVLNNGVLTVLNAQMVSLSTGIGAAGNVMEMTVQPNPAHSEITMTIPSVSKGHYELIVTDMTGRIAMVENHAVEGVNIKTDVSRLPSGMYIIRVNSVTGNWVQKVVIR
jgi:hypothetical protein